MTTTPTTLPLSRLKSSDRINARPETDTGLDELAASIAAKGLIQPLVVRPAKKGDAYEVIDGRRRFRALQRLVKAKQFRSNGDVPVQVRNEDDAGALETSLMANTVRLPMHPVDQHEVFAKLAGEGLDTSEIAARFGLRPRTVEQHLALGSLAPEIREAWRAEKINAETAQAFTMLPDKRQVALYNELAGDNGGHVSAWSVRRHVTGEKDRTDSADVVFVGLAAYEAAGGTVTRSLFDEHGWIDNAELLEVLVQEKLDKACRALEADGWAWAKRTDEVAYRYSYATQRVTPVYTPEEETRKAELTAKLNADDELMPDADGSLTPETREALEAAIDDADQAATARGYTPAQRKRLGCFVSNIDGRLQVEYGKRAPKAQRDIEDAIGEADDAGGDAPETAAPAETAGLSGALVTTLTEMQTIAAKRAMTTDGVQALRALYATLRLRETYGAGPMKVTTQGMSQRRYEPDSETEETFADLLASAPKSLAALAADLAPLLAEALDLRSYNPARERDDEKALVATLSGSIYLDGARDVFDPADFFARAPKDVAVAAIAEMREAGILLQSTPELAKMKKGGLAAVATSIAKLSGWLPELLRHPDYALTAQHEETAA